LHKKYGIQYFNQITTQAEPGDLCLLKTSLSYTEWLFVEYLCRNLDDQVASDLVTNLADNIRSQVVYSYSYYPTSDLRQTKGMYVVNED